MKTDSTRKQQTPNYMKGELSDRRFRNRVVYVELLTAARKLKTRVKRIKRRVPQSLLESVDLFYSELEKAAEAGFRDPNN